MRPMYHSMIYQPPKRIFELNCIMGEKLNVTNRYRLKIFELPLKKWSTAA